MRWSCLWSLMVLSVKFLPFISLPNLYLLSRSIPLSQPSIYSRSASVEVFVCWGDRLGVLWRPILRTRSIDDDERKRRRNWKGGGRKGKWHWLEGWRGRGSEVVLNRAVHIEDYHHHSLSLIPSPRTNKDLLPPSSLRSISVSTHSLSSLSLSHSRCPNFPFSFLFFFFQTRWGPWN